MKDICISFTIIRKKKFKKKCSILCQKEASGVGVEKTKVLTVEKIFFVYYAETGPIKE